MNYWAHVVKALETDGACVAVTVARVEGSAPREEGASMVVTRHGFHGSIGGGALEWQALARAQSLLGKPAQSIFTSHLLGPDLGQCCGGRVQLKTEVLDRGSLDAARVHAAESADTRRLYLFGAGHVGRALVLALAPLPFDVIWIDGRDGAFPAAAPGNVTMVRSDDPVAELLAAPAGSFALAMTHSHALDFEIVDAALRDRRFAYVGLIGSASKRARFAKRLRDGGVAEQDIAGLVCPIGVAGIRSKHPSAIALATAAQLLAKDEALRAAALNNVASRRQA
jgi:xanthine dehydrogenase accessory factor